MGKPEEILELLTDPDSIARWAPIPFEVLELTGERLAAGSQARVRGELAGREVEFDVDVREAHNRCLSLTASGPLLIDAAYEFRPAGDGSRLRASIRVCGRGPLGRMLAGAVQALLAAGLLQLSVARIGRELEPATRISLGRISEEGLVH